MDMTNIFSLLGGLGLFLYGMRMMSDGLEQAAGNQMKLILEKLTSNRFLGVAVGALITAVIQSSSATTVMVVGFVNSGLMKLENAVWIIMGANIGTTITGQLVVMDIDAIAPLLCFMGVALITFFKSKKLDAYGGIVAGLGILFMGMNIMSTSMAPLREVPAFINLLTSFENPILGLLVGIVFTSIIQSSSASVGILQALAKSGLVTLSGSIWMIFGFDIGTCVTAVIASLGTSKNAKRSTIIHLAFNIIGTLLFVLIITLTPFVDWMVKFTPTDVAAQIANTNTIFKIVTMLFLLPFGHYLVRLSYLILPDSKDDESLGLKHLDFNIFESDYHLGSSAIINTQLFNEVQNMLVEVINNVKRAFALMDNFSEEGLDKVIVHEEYINELNKEITRYTTNAISLEMPVENGQELSIYIKIASNLERIGDKALSIAYTAQAKSESKKPFSINAMEEIHIMATMTINILEELMVINAGELKEIMERVDNVEESINQTCVEFQTNQMKRLKEKSCTVENSVLYTKTLSDYERIGAQGVKIAVYFNQLNSLHAVLKMKEV